MPHRRELRPIPWRAVAFTTGMAIVATLLARAERPRAHDLPVLAAAAAVAPLPAAPARPGVVRAEVPASGRLTATLYDPAGTRVRVLADGVPHPCGTAQLAWDGRDEAGRPVPSGAYALKLEVRSERVRALRMTRLHWPTRAPGA